MWFVKLFGIVVAALVVMSVLSHFRKQFPWVKTDTYKYLASALKDSYIHRVLVAFDTFFNVVFGGKPGETISSRVGRWSIRTRGNEEAILFAKWMVAWLDFINPDHSFKAMTSDLARAQDVVNTETAALQSIGAI